MSNFKNDKIIKGVWINGKFKNFNIFIFLLIKIIEVKLFYLKILL